MIFALYTLTSFETKILLFAFIQGYEQLHFQLYNTMYFPYGNRYDYLKSRCTPVDVRRCRRFPLNSLIKNCVYEGDKGELRYQIMHERVQICLRKAIMASQ